MLVLVGGAVGSRRRASFSALISPVRINSWCWAASWEQDPFSWVWDSWYSVLCLSEAHVREWAVSWHPDLKPNSICTNFLFHWSLKSSLCTCKFTAQFGCYATAAEHVCSWRPHGLFTLLSLLCCLSLEWLGIKSEVLCPMWFCELADSLKGLPSCCSVTGVPRVPQRNHSSCSFYVLFFNCLGPISKLSSSSSTFNTILCKPFPWYETQRSTQPRAIA